VTLTVITSSIKTFFFLADAGNVVHSFDSVSAMRFFRIHSLQVVGLRG